MPLRSTAVSALFLIAGCAAGAPIEPTAKPRDVHTARPTAVTQPAENAATDAALGATKQKLTTTTTPDAQLPLRSTAPATPAASSAPKSDPFGDVGFKEVNQKDWVAGIRDNIARQEKVAPTDLCVSPGLLRAAFVRSSPVAAPTRPGRRIPPRRHEIVVVDNQGRRVASFRPIVSRGSDDPPRDLRFLSDERLVYEVVARAPDAASLAPSKSPASKAKDRPTARAQKPKPNARPTRGTSHVALTAVPPEPPRLFVIQPLAPRARPIRCQGFNFTFTREHDHLAFVGGQGDTTFVAVDGAQVYPRRGHTIVASAPVWSKDGHGLAFLELSAAHPARLVVLAAVDDPAGDMTWDLPADANIDGASVIWAGTGKLVVRKTALRPIFSTSFVTER